MWMPAQDETGGGQQILMTEKHTGQAPATNEMVQP
jgi:hypothetical protein